EESISASLPRGSELRFASAPKWAAAASTLLRRTRQTLRNETAIPERADGGPRPARGVRRLPGFDPAAKISHLGGTSPGKSSRPGDRIEARAPAGSRGGLVGRDCGLSRSGGSERLRGRVTCAGKGAPTWERIAIHFGAEVGGCGIDSVATHSADATKRDCDSRARRWRPQASPRRAP